MATSYPLWFSLFAWAIILLPPAAPGAVVVFVGLVCYERSPFRRRLLALGGILIVVGLIVGLVCLDRSLGDSKLF
jgi:hypothetical protein